MNKTLINSNKYSEYNKFITNKELLDLVKKILIF